MKFNLVPSLAVASAVLAGSVAGNLFDDDFDIHNLIAYIGGNEGDELERYVDNRHRFDRDVMAEDMEDAHEEIDDDVQRMDDRVIHVGGLDSDVADTEPVYDDDRDDDASQPYFEVLSVGYERKNQNMYDRGKPKPIQGYAKPAIRSVNDPAPTPAPPLKKAPNFDDFNNTKPQNEGNCLHAINKERQTAGVPELSNNQTLIDLAARHSAYMAASQALSHDGFWSYRFDAVPSGVIGVGEVVVADDVSNAANGPAKRAVDRWMGSIEHKALLLRPDMFIMGCSTSQGSDGRFYATALVCSK